jgi:hypothetical protein
VNLVGRGFVRKHPERLSSKLGSLSSKFGRLSSKLGHLSSKLYRLSRHFRPLSREPSRVRRMRGPHSATCRNLIERTESRSICYNNTRQGSTRKGTLKPAGFLFPGVAIPALSVRVAVP